MEKCKFDICPCVKHGHFVFSNGKESEEIFFYQQGFIVLTSLVACGKIRGDEFPTLLNQLKNSSLPISYDEFKKEVEKRFEEFMNTAIADIEELFKVMQKEDFVARFHGNIMN